MILTRTRGPKDWRKGLADPVKHWRPGYSAMSLAYCWEQAKGFPVSVQQALATHPALSGIELLLATPEYKVLLPGGRAASQNDLFVLARSREGLVTIMVEGKVAEPFGPLVAEWLVDASPGKIERLAFLCQTLALSTDQVGGVRYQLLHRTASALIEARRFHATSAVLLVHSFSKSKEWFGDFRTFAGLYRIDPEPGRIYSAGKLEGAELFLGWVSDPGDYGEAPGAITTVTGTAAARKCECCGHHEIGIETSDGKFIPVRPGDKVQITGDDIDATD